MNFNSKRAYSLADFIADDNRSSTTYYIPQTIDTPDEAIERNLGELQGTNAEVTISGYDESTGTFGTLDGNKDGK